MPPRNKSVPSRVQFESLEGRQLLTVASPLTMLTRNYLAQIQPQPHAVHSAAVKPVLDVENADFLPFSDRLIFNVIKAKNKMYGDTTHQIATLLLRNTGSAALTFKSLAISSGSPWVLVNAPKAPFTLQPGKSLSLQVKFVATTVPKHTDNQINDTKTTNKLTPQQAGGVYNGTLTITTNDPVTPTRVVTLAGYWQAESEHENEPSLQTILNLVGGWKTKIATNQIPDLTEGNSPVYYGEELQKAFFWQAADSTKSVVVRQVAAFHNEQATQTISWYTKGKTTSTKIFTAAMNEGQSLLPHLNSNTNAYAAGTFKPGTAVFGWNVDGEYSDDTRNLMGTGKAAGHHVRFFPVRDRNGNIEPNNYFIAMDYSNTMYENYDFQDAVYYVENIKPVK